MKKLLTALLALCMVFAFAACSSDTSDAGAGGTSNGDAPTPAGGEAGDPGETLTCGIILDWMGASIFVEAVNNIKEVAKDLNVEIITWDCQVSPELMVQGLENFIEADVDMIYLQNWTGYDAIEEVVQRALEKGIVIVAYDEDVEGAIYCTMANMDDLGYALGDATVQAFQKYSQAEDDTIVVIAAMNTEYSVTRTNLALERINAALPNANVVTFDVVAYGGSGQSAGVQIGESLIGAYDNVAAILATDNANTAIGVAEAYTAAGITDGLGCITNDGSLDEFIAIAEDSVFYATVDLGLVDLMTDLFVKGVEYTRNGTVTEPRLVYFKSDIVSADNIEQYYNAETGERYLD